MEDVAFALCLLDRGIQVLNYGFHSTEFVVNFHQARTTLLKCSGEVERSLHWDAQPPPLSACLLVVHPVEHDADLHVVHECIRRREISSGHCMIDPMKLARQAEVKLHASRSEFKPFWDPSQFDPLDSCFRRLGPAPKCEWRPLSSRCLGLSFYPPASSVAACSEICCASSSCRLYQFRPDLGCWLGELDSLTACEHTERSPVRGLWSGGGKIEHFPSGGTSWGQELPRDEYLEGQQHQDGLFASAALCWRSLPGRYLPHWSSAGAMCLSEPDAKQQCLENLECDGVTKQWDMCDGHMWTLRGGRIGRTEEGYDASNLESQLLSRVCAKAIGIL